MCSFEECQGYHAAAEEVSKMLFIFRMPGPQTVCISGPAASAMSQIGLGNQFFGILHIPILFISLCSNAEAQMWHPINPTDVLASEDLLGVREHLFLLLE